MSDLHLKAQLRTEFGKGAARRARREGLVPAVIYGHGMDPVHVSLPGHDTMMALKQSNALITIEVEDGTEYLTFVKDVQREVIRRFVEHLDLLVVRKGEKIEVDIPVVTEGETAPQTIMALESTTLTLLVEATSIPEQIVVDVAGLPAGSNINAGQLTLPEGTELAVEPDHVVVVVTEPQLDVESDTDGGEEGAEGAESSEAAE